MCIEFPYKFVSLTFESFHLQVQRTEYSIHLFFVIFIYFGGKIKSDENDTPKLAMMFDLARNALSSFAPSASDQ